MSKGSDIPPVTPQPTIILSDGLLEKGKMFQVTKSNQWIKTDMYVRFAELPAESEQWVLCSEPDGKGTPVFVDKSFVAFDQEEPIRVQSLRVALLDAD